jgi:glycosyltransferase involved in cell wall biosynthesis
MSNMKRAKIVHLTSAHPARDPRIFHKECCSLAHAGFEVVLVAQHEHDEVADGVAIRALPKPAGRLERMTRGVWRACREALRENAEVFQFHDPELLPVGLFLAMCGKKVVSDVHEDVPRQILSKFYLPSWFRRPLAWALEKTENFSAQHFAAVITATPAIAQRFATRNCNTIIIRNYPPLALPAANVMPWSERPLSVVYAGLISRERGIVEMVRAMAMLPAQIPARLLLAGRFVNQALFHEVCRLPGWEKVDYVGVIDQTQVLELLGRARIGLLVLHPEPNYVNSLPIKLFEYMAAGLPVLASRFPVWEEIIEAANCGVLVDPLRPSVIAEAIETLLCSPQGPTLGSRGRAAVADHFNWEQESQQLIALYDRLTAADA